jgi:hypothetical protein
LLKKLTLENKREYDKIFKEYLEENYIEIADDSYQGQCAYLPHRPVIKVDKTTTKIRPVFDGSANKKGRPSLNDLLEVGPNLNPDILSVLLRFRQHRIAWTADITQAFLQIGIQKELPQIFPVN